MRIQYVIFSTLITFFLVSTAMGQFGLCVGNEHGIGLIAKVGLPAIKFEFGGGLSPMLVFWDISYQKNYIKFYLPFTGGAGVNFALTPPTRKDRLGLKLEVNYNSIIKIGLGGGIDYILVDKPHKIVIGGGLLYFSNAYDELLDRLNDEEDTSYTKEDVSAVLMNLRPYVSISILSGK